MFDTVYEIVETTSSGERKALTGTEDDLWSHDRTVVQKRLEELQKKRPDSKFEIIGW